MDREVKGPSAGDDEAATRSRDLMKATMEPPGRFAKGDARAGERSSDLMKATLDERAGPVK
jgi:hypothetical protein